MEDKLQKIRIPEVRQILESLVSILPTWKGGISIEAIKYSLSVKVNGKVFCYLTPKRDRFLVETHNQEGKWVSHPVYTQEDLDALTDLLKGNMEKKSK